jgi:hypothetical protein
MINAHPPARKIVAAFRRLIRYNPADASLRVPTRT